MNTTQTTKTISVSSYILNILDTEKCENIQHYTGIQNYLSKEVIVATASVERHCKAVAEKIAKYLKQKDIQFVNSMSVAPSEASNDWVVFDCESESLMIHIMVEKKRFYYKIDQLMQSMIVQDRPAKKPRLMNVSTSNKQISKTANNSKTPKIIAKKTFNSDKATSKTSPVRVSRNEDKFDNRKPKASVSKQSNSNIKISLKNANNKAFDTAKTPLKPKNPKTNKTSGRIERDISKADQSKTSKKNTRNTSSKVFNTITKTPSRLSKTPLTGKKSAKQPAKNTATTIKPKSRVNSAPRIKQSVKKIQSKTKKPITRKDK